MASRRVFIAGGVALAALATSPVRAAFGSAQTPRVGAARDGLIVLLDSRFATGGAFAADAAAAGHQIFGFDSDVAIAWMNEIEPRLRSGPLAFAGLTSTATLFCIELLARDYGARMLQRIEQPTGAIPRLLPLLAEIPAAPLAPLAPVASTDGSAFVSWLIATDTRRRAPLAAPTAFAPRG